MGPSSPSSAQGLNCLCQGALAFALHLATQTPEIGNADHQNIETQNARNRKRKAVVGRRRNPRSGRNWGLLGKSCAHLCRDPDYKPSLQTHAYMSLHATLAQPRRLALQTLFPHLQSTLILQLFFVMADFSPDAVRDGELSAWEVAKAYAFHIVLSDVAELLEQTPSDLVGGGRVDTYIAKKLQLKGGGQPEPRTVRRWIEKCSAPGWYPGCGAGRGAGGGRPTVYSDHQKSEVARVGMELKRKLIAPTPRRVRARLPNVSANPETGEQMSRCTINRIYKVLCYDEKEDDPWQWLTSRAQDMLPARLRPLRVACCKHIISLLSATTWRSHVAFDPCYSLLPKTSDALEETMVAAMGAQKWMSKESRGKGANCRPPSSTKTQSNAYHYTRVDWTPIFARGKVLIYVVDVDAAKANPKLPSKLTDSKNLAKFVMNVLPGLLQQMKRKHGWADIPRTLVHDPASYMVPPVTQRLQTDFARAIRSAGFRSWAGDAGDDCSWMVKKLGDVYLHETVISHIRRLLDGEFAHQKIYETPEHFVTRMKKVETHMNSASFKAPDGRGLEGLAKDLMWRCEEVVRLKGERIPK